MDKEQAWKEFKGRLSVRAANIIDNMREEDGSYYARAWQLPFEVPSDLNKWTDDDLGSVRNCGQVTIRELRRVLAERKWEAYLPGTSCLWVSYSSAPSGQAWHQ